MKIISRQCPACGTIVAGNQLERNRIMKCPGLDCHEELRFQDLDEVDQTHLENNRDSYTL